MTDQLTTNIAGAPGETDSTASADSAVTLRERFTQPGSAAPGSANQMVETVEAVEAPDGSAAPSEKIGSYVNVQQLNPSAPGVTRDLVGRETVAEDDVAGRAWAEHAAVSANAPGSTTVVAELDSINNTATVDLDATHSGPDSHIVMRVMADGSAPSTAGIVVGQGNQPFVTGLEVAPGAVAPGGAAVDLENERGAAVEISNSNPIVGKLADGRLADLLYLNRDNVLVIGGPGIKGVAIWNGADYAMFSR